MANELDELMSRLLDDPIGCTDDDIDQIINYQRKYRAQPGKGAKKVSASEGPKLDLASLGMTKPKVKIMRRI